MKYINSFELFELRTEISTKVYAKVCERYLWNTDIWKRMKPYILRNEPELVIRRVDEFANKNVQAQFDMGESTMDRIVVSMLMHYRGGEDSHSGTLAHELVHSLQFIEGNGTIDLFVGVTTEEFSKFSKREIWTDLLLAIYLVDGIEIEAWNAECKWHIPHTSKYMFDWMGKFNPVEFAEKLNKLKVIPNSNNMTSFDQFPFVWVDSYKYWYNDLGSPLDPEIVKLGKMNKGALVRFLEYYDKKFKAYKSKLLK
jgi:hypothetical protein